MISLFEFFNDHESFISSDPIPDGSEFVNTSSPRTPLPPDERKIDDINNSQPVESSPDDEKKHSDTLIRNGVAEGRWDAPLSPWKKFTSNFWTPTSTGDLYQRYDNSGNPTDKYVKFDDGTEYKYDLQNKELMKKMYDRSVTRPDYDPSDLLLLPVGGTVGKAIMKRPIQNVITRLPQGAKDNFFIKNGVEHVLTLPISYAEERIDNYVQHN